MQVIRFGKFTPAQQVRLDALTGGKDFKQVVVDAFNPMTAGETQDFDKTVAGTTKQMGWALGWLSPTQAESIGWPMINSFLNGSAQKGLMDQLAKTPDPQKQRSLLQYSAAAAVGITEYLAQWPKIPTDKTFDALEKMVELMKTTIKF